MSFIYLPKDASRASVKEAENARKNRAEIVKAFSHGKVSRRDLIKWGLISSAGALAPIHGLNPFVTSAHGQVPTGTPRSPLNGVQPFSTAMPRFDVIDRKPIISGQPHPFGAIVPTAQANQTPQLLDSALVGGATNLYGPIEGRPGGPIWAHQQFTKFPPQIAIEMSQAGAQANTAYNPGVANHMNSEIDPTSSFPLQFHPGLPKQDSNSVWTFQGTVPPKLVMGKYGEPLIFRHHNKLPADETANNGFGRHTISTHEHNGHHGAENDGFTGAFFFPGQYYDYHYPIVLAGWSTMNVNATDKMASSPADNGGLNKVAGDWHETMSTHWFHDHCFSFTSQNVYKGNAGMFNLYSGLDRGNEGINDGVNLRLPSGTANSCVNLDYRPYFEVERRKYRFRILNASVSRFFKVALSDGSTMIQIANDGNLFPHPVPLTQLDEQGIAERYDIVIDFSRYSLNSKVWMVNLCEHQDGKKPAKDLTLAEALSGNSQDPCVGKFLEFRIVRNPAQPDLSQVPDTMIPNPDLSQVPLARERIFEFGRGGKQTTNDPVSSFFGPWGVKTDGGDMLNADF